jgi:hypothetical protein
MIQLEKQVMIYHMPLWSLEFAKFDNQSYAWDDAISPHPPQPVFKHLPMVGCWYEWDFEPDMREKALSLELSMLTCNNEKHNPVHQ